MYPTITVKLVYPEQVGGEEVDEVVLRPLTVGEEMELSRKYQPGSPDHLFWTTYKRIVRFGHLEKVDPEAVRNMLRPNFDLLVEAGIAIDRGYTDLDAFRNSAEYKRLFGGA